MNKDLNSICQCNKCGKFFERKWIRLQKKLSRINEMAYWTEKNEGNPYHFLCRGCLKEWYLNDKVNFDKLVAQRKKIYFSNYYRLGFFDKDENKSSESSNKYIKR